MFVGVLLFFLSGAIAYKPIKVNYRCSNSSDRSMTFEPASDGVSGRYTTELCTLKNPNITNWKIDLSYYDNPDYCNASSGLHRRLRRPDHLHSTNTLDINDPTDCSHVCYSMDFDLIFTGCYGIKSSFKEGKKTMPPFDSFHYISNNFTNKSILGIKPYSSLTNHDNDVSLNWYLGIPLTEYEVELCRKKHNDSMECLWKHNVTGQCVERGARVLACELGAPPGCYQARLEHAAPWISGVFNRHSFVHFDFCYGPLAAPAVQGGAGRAWWWAAGAALALAALGALLLRRSLQRHYHKTVLSVWLNRSSAAEASAAPVRSGAVLLLYAREGERGAAPVSALKALLQSATGEQVYDLFSPEVVAMSAASPARWVRGVLARPDVRVLLLQSPAIAALYRSQLTDNDASLKLQEPLLGRRAMYRAPQFGDQLLQLALTQLAETPSDHHLYHKHYLATYSELETDILSQVVPYRRYVLPDAAPVLLQDLGARPCDPALLRAFTRAAHDFVAHARDQPDYLMDELVIV